MHIDLSIALVACSALFLAIGAKLGQAIMNRFFDWLES